MGYRISVSVVSIYSTGGNTSSWTHFKQQWGKARQTDVHCKVKLKRYKNYSYVLQGNVKSKWDFSFPLKVMLESLSKMEDINNKHRVGFHCLSRTERECIQKFPD